MEEKTIKKIPPVPFGVMMGAISAIIGLIAGIIFAGVFGAIGSTLSSVSGSTIDLGGFAMLFGVGAIIIMPISGFIGGLIEGIIIAVIYNLLAPMVGGIKLQFEETSRTPPPP